MKITDVKQQLKREDRYSIYIDGKYAFSLSEAELVRLGLRQGLSLTAEKLAELQQDSKRDKAYDRSLHYIEIRPRSEQEIRQYLKRKQYEPELINAVAAKLYDIDLLNDERFARQWVEWRLASKPSSKRKLQAELIQKGISRDIIQEVMAEIEPETELEQVKALIGRKARLSQYQDRQKLMAYLARQGFSYDLIKRALDT